MSGGRAAILEVIFSMVGGGGESCGEVLLIVMYVVTINVYYTGL